MRKTVSARPWAAAASAVLLLPAAAAAQDVLEPARSAWRQAQYPVAALRVSELPKPERRKGEALYIQGTSACRIPTLERNGQVLLSELASLKTISPAWRTVVQTELTKCGQAATPQPYSREAAVPASMSISAKTFYWLDNKAAPVSRPVAVSPVKDDDLLARRRPPGDPGVEAIAKAQLAGCRFARTARVAVCSGSNHTPAQLAEIAGAADRHLAWLKAAFDLDPPPYTLTVYLVPNVGSLNGFAGRSHGIQVGYGTIGYALDKDASVVAVVTGQTYGTVLHEITHLVMGASFPGAPEWLEEGLASLYETSKACGGVVLGAPNWRGQVLQQSWARKVRLEDAVGAPWYRYQTADDMSDGMRTAAEYFSLARYLMLHLQLSGQLPEVIRQMRAEAEADLARAEDLTRPLDAAPPDAAGRSARLLTRLTARPLSETEAAARALARDQALPGVPPWANEAARRAGLAPCRDLASATDIKKTLEVDQ